MEILSILAQAPGLVAGVLVLAGGTYAWFRIRRQVRMISRAMFGTSSLAEGLERQADILAETPKSVSGMTKLCLPQIEGDFPEFHWPQWRQMCENMLKAYLAALSSQDLTVLTGLGNGSDKAAGERYGKGRQTADNTNTGKNQVSAASEELRRQVELRIEDQRRRGVRESYRQVKIHQTEISRYQKEAGMCIIKLQSAVEYFYEETDAALVGSARKAAGGGTSGQEEGSGAGENGDHGGKRPVKITGIGRRQKKTAEDTVKNRKVQTRYNMELVYIQDLSKINDLATAVGVTCPNCGAPITRLGSKFCEYCGTGVTPVDVRVWKLHRVEGENH